MTWRWGHGRAAIVSLLLLSCACSNSDPIQSANVNVAVVASTSPAYTGQYRWVHMAVDQITVRPLDAQANSYLQIPLGLLSSFGDVDVRSTAPLNVAATPLRVGSYLVESIRIAQITMNVNPQSPIGGSTVCNGSDLIEVRVASAIVMPFANPPLLQVTQDGTAQLNIVVDGPEFVDMITIQPYTCGVDPFPTPTPAELAQVLTVQ